MSVSHRFNHEPFLVTPGKKFRLKDHDPGATNGIKDKAEAKKSLLEDVSLLADAQDLLWATKQYSLIIIFQAMDAAGKDSTIEHVMSGVNPQGVSVYSFKAPNEEERLHHFLWRPTRVLPERGRIAIFNRSYYEEVLVVRVHPQFLDSQWIAPDLRGRNLDKIWETRFEEINEFEKVYSHQNTVVLKFFLNVSRKEQKKRFLERLDNPEKNWKFAAADVAERAHWDEYMLAYEEMLNATSTKHAPWYVIPADKKWFMRAAVADIIAARIAELKLTTPQIGDKDRTALAAARQQLMAETE